MIETLLTLTLVCAAGSLALQVLRFYLARRGHYAIDAQRIGDILATRLLDSYRGELDQMHERGVRRWARERYMTLVTGLGLPSSAADAVVDQVARCVRQAQGQDEEQAFTGFYE